MSYSTYGRILSNTDFLSLNFTVRITVCFAYVTRLINIRHIKPVRTSHAQVQKGRVFIFETFWTTFQTRNQQISNIPSNAYLPRYIMQLLHCGQLISLRVDQLGRHKGKLNGFDRHTTWVARRSQLRSFSHSYCDIAGMSFFPAASTAIIEALVQPQCFYMKPAGENMSLPTICIVDNRCSKISLV